MIAYRIRPKNSSRPSNRSALRSTRSFNGRVPAGRMCALIKSLPLPKGRMMDDMQADLKALCDELETPYSYEDCFEPVLKAMLSLRDMEEEMPAGKLRLILRALVPELLATTSRGDLPRFKRHADAMRIKGLETDAAFLERVICAIQFKPSLPPPPPPTKQRAVPIEHCLTCPICQQIMTDPVTLAATGHSYDLHCINLHIQWCSKTCPASNVDIRSQLVAIPNGALRSLIAAYLNHQSTSTTRANKLIPRSDFNPIVLGHHTELYTKPECEALIKKILAAADDVARMEAFQTLIMRALPPEQEIFEALASIPNIMHMFTESLSNARYEVLQCATLHVLHGLAYFVPSMRCVIAESTKLMLSVKNVCLASPLVSNCAILLITFLVQGGDARAWAAVERTPGLIDRLVEISLALETDQSRRQNAVNSIMFLSIHSSSPAWLDLHPRVVPALVQCARESADQEIRTLSVMALAKCVCVDNARSIQRMMAQESVLPTLVQVMCDHDPKAQLGAVSTLLNMTVIWNRIALGRTPGLFPALLSLLRNCPANCELFAARLFSDLLVFEANSNLVSIHDACPVLTKLLDHSSVADVRMHASLSMNLLAMANPSNVLHMMRDEALVQSLMRGLHDRSEMVKIGCAGCINNISDHPEAKHPMCQQGMLEGVIKLIASPHFDAMVLESAAGCLNSWAVEERNHMLIATTPHALKMIAKLLKNRSINCQIMMAAVVANLGWTRESRELILQTIPEVLPKLKLQAQKQENPELVRCSLHALMVLEGREES